MDYAAVTLVEVAKATKAEKVKAAKVPWPHPDPDIKPKRRKVAPWLVGSGVSLATGVGVPVAAGLGYGGYRANEYNKVYGLKKSDASLVAVSKMGDWKNIEQRKTEARNARRSKKYGEKAAITGGGVLAFDTASTKHGVKSLKHAVGAYRNARQPQQYAFGKPESGAGVKVAGGSRRYAFDSARASLRQSVPKGAARKRMAVPLVGAALVAGGLSTIAAGGAKERYSEKRIKVMRSKRDKK